MVTANYYLDCRRVKEGEKAPLRFMITKDRKKTMIATNIFIRKEDWDGNTVKNDPELTYLLEQRKAKVKAFIFDKETKGEFYGLDVREIKKIIEQNIFGENIHKNKNNDFKSRFESFCKSRKAKRTREIYTHTLNTIEKLIGRDVLKVLKFEDVSLRWLKDLDEKMTKEELSKNTRNIHFRNIRAVFNDALDDEIIRCYPFRKFKIRPEKTRKRSLTVEQLRNLFDYPVEPYAEFYRDMFKLIFMLCGINVVDLYNLTGITKGGRIEYSRSKTKRLYSIKVEPEALKIIEKYKGKSGLLLISDRWIEHRQFCKQMNRALRFIGARRENRGGEKVKDSGPFPGLTSYWARHTWATIAASLDIPKETIAAALGHGGNSVTDIYIDFDQKKIDEANRKVLDWVLYEKK